MVLFNILFHLHINVFQIMFTSLVKKEEIQKDFSHIPFPNAYTLKQMKLFDSIVHFLRSCRQTKGNGILVFHGVSPDRTA